jgi:hypothetical protein
MTPCHPIRHPFLVLLVLVLAALPSGAAEVSKYLPDDTEVVAFVNVRQLLDAPLVQRHAGEQLKGALKENVELQRLLAAAGFDPLRDVQSITFAAPGKDTEKQALFIVSGSFHLDRIHALADELARKDPDALKLHRQGGLRIYETRSWDAAGTGFAAFADRGTLLISPSREPILAALRAAEQNRPRGKAALPALIQQADGTQTMWFAALATKDVKDLLRSNSQTAGVADRITSFTGTVSFSDVVQAAVQVHATDLRAAGEVQRLMEALKGFVQFAALSNREYGPLFCDLLDAMKVSSQRNTVTIGGTVSPDLIEKGLKKGRKP